MTFALPHRHQSLRINVLEGADIARAGELLQTNMRGTVAMTRAVMPAMRALRGGAKLNFGRASVRLPGPRFV
ncbi:Rossmann-fold NAD(P)-binding domain-containing protein [Pseudooceanicola marinus]|uniref:hypothetical protein n=1 Tax=Pseudooceanicola marinus TaxID=396013 RepID=UPI00117AB8A1|nr:hypothetical protein [Pseudooceanicola marinus]